MASPALSLFENALALTTPPTSGEEITRFLLFLNFSFMSGIICLAEKMLSTGISKKP